MTAPEPSAKAAITVSEMAELCLISRSRWYEMVASGVFPKPIQIPSAKRPLYDRHLQEKCLEIRATGIALSGAPVCFNRKPKKNGSHKSKAHRPAPQTDPLIEPILDAVKALGLTTTPQAVTDAVAVMYPTGIAGQDQGDVIRKTFLYLQGKRP